MDYMFSGAALFNQNLGSWGIENVTSMIAMFNVSAMSECNYDRTLKGWDSQINNHAPILSSGGVKYGVNTYRDNLMAKGWTITDAGAGDVCPDALRIKSQTSITDNVEFELSFYPNPASKSFQVNGFEEKVQITLLDISGKVVLQTQAMNNIQIDVSSLSKGIYILQAIDRFSHSIYEKLIIE
jgi:hypothetical protein